jgi:hypothetical protein
MGHEVNTPERPWGHSWGRRWGRLPENLPHPSGTAWAAAALTRRSVHRLRDNALGAGSSGYIQRVTCAEANRLGRAWNSHGAAR